MTDTSKATHLWKVQVQYESGDSTNPFTFRTTLLITTDKVSISLAVRKASAFIKENRAEYPRAAIYGAEYDGEIDA
jgi:regulatory protein YycH of two-component signal transduction system YycFG